MRKKRFLQDELGFYEDPKCHNAIKLNGEWDFIVCLALGQILQLLWMGMRFLRIGIGSKEDTSCRHAGEGFLRCLCHK